MPKATQKALKEKMSAVNALLTEKYPEAECALLWGGEDPWRLLVMARLSAQCTDRRVNLVSLPLFEKYPTAMHMAQADISELEEIVRPCGLYRRKAYDLKQSSEQLLSRFGGVVPRSMEELLTLAGVGRKIANLMLGDVYRLPAIVCDTHLMRICGRLGFYPTTLKDPVKIEKLLTPIIDPEVSSDFCHRIVLFGREVCSAVHPHCEICEMREAGLCEGKK